MARKQDNYKHIYAKNRQEFRDWLAQNFEQKESIWLVYYKVKSGKPSITYNEAVEEALCYGWIDSKVNSVDEERYKQIFSPRKPKSPWSRSNKNRLKRLFTENKMMPSGIAIIEKAKENGYWEILDDIEDLITPDDLQAALDENVIAKDYYEAFNDSSKKAILWWIKSAKRPETRIKRISQTVELAAKNIKAKP
jgi:uncharacterized protein YdeI (YjbR/CyaY-like superfamily)